MENQPYKKLIEDSKSELETMQKQIRKSFFLPFRFAKLKDYEKRLEKINSKLESLKDQLSYQDRAFQDQIRQEHGKDLQKIVELAADVALDLLPNNWLRGMLDNDIFKFFIQLPIMIMKTVTWIMDKLGLPVGWMKKLIANVERHLLPQTT